MMTILEFEGRGEWAEWMAVHHTDEGVWLRFARKGSDARSVTHSEALEIALSYGWIDGQVRGESDRAWLQWFGPRTKKSIWSKINRQKALAMIDAGGMHPAGLKEVERARADGRWEQAYDPQRTAAVPEDLQAALSRNTKAKAFFAKLDSKNRYAVLHRIQIAKKPETRERRIRQFVEMLAKGEKLHQ
jgi:uncharacterized protein YdeI (YjbR/CyaY-like superfamily)